MKNQRLALFFGGLLISSAYTTSAQAATYEIDPTHTTAQFSVRHLMVSNVRGEFTGIKGTVKYDPKDPAASVVDVTIDANTVNTRVEKRDIHLRGDEFFDTAKYPVLTFKSKKVDKTSDTTLRVTGDLTIHGVSKEIVLDVDNLTPEIVDPWGNARIGASATAKIDRKDFGLAWNKALETGGVVVGDAVSITIDVELVKQKPAA